MTAREDPMLALRCYDVDMLATRARDLLQRHLEGIKEEKDIYYFAQRLKGQKGIQYKVLRKRDEITIEDSQQNFDPEDVTDAWGCRFITFFQSQIPDVAHAILDFIKNNKILSIESINVYTNRTDKDPLSIATKIETLVRSYDAKYSARAESRTRFLRASRRDGYSSVHFILNVAFQAQPNPSAEAQQVKIEIQIRDLFDEAWCQISHRLQYGREKDFFAQTGQYPNPNIEELAGFHLNALKAVADGCSQFSDQIKHIYEELRGRLGAVDPRQLYESVTRLTTDKELVLNEIPEKSENQQLKEHIRRGYDLQESARDAADDNLDKRVARNNYLAASKEFRKALEMAGDITEITIPQADGRKLGAYLKIELANALIFSVPDVQVEIAANPEFKWRFDEAVKIYRDLEGTYPQDPVVYFRKASAERRLAKTEAEFEGLIGQLGHAKQLLDAGYGRKSVDTKLISHLILIERAITKHDYSNELKDQVSKKTLRETLLREALEDVQTVIAGIDLESDRFPEMERAFHRAASNSLWFYSRLKELHSVISDGDTDNIKKHVRSLRETDFWQIAQYYPTTIENLMYGYEMIGHEPAAIEMAEKNLRLLTQIANDRRPLAGEGSPLDYLDIEEREIYQRAQDLFYSKRPKDSFWRLLGFRGTPSGSV